MRSQPDAMEQETFQAKKTAGNVENTHTQTAHEP